MTLNKEEKQAIISQYQRSGNDTGSAEVQVSILTKKINILTDHLRDNKKDHAGRRGLLMMVSRRRRLLDFLKRTAPQKYVNVIQSLGIRK